MGGRVRGRVETDDRRVEKPAVGIEGRQELKHLVAHVGVVLSECGVALGSRELDHALEQFLDPLGAGFPHDDTLAMAT